MGNRTIYYMEWKQKHNIMFWYEKIHPIYNYASEATHQPSDEYSKRGKWNRVSRVSNARKHLVGFKWITKRYSRYNKTIIN